MRTRSRLSTKFRRRSPHRSVARLAPSPLVAATPLGPVVPPPCLLVCEVANNISPRSSALAAQASRCEGNESVGSCLSLVETVPYQAKRPRRPQTAGAASQQPSDRLVANAIEIGQPSRSRQARARRRQGSNNHHTADEVARSDASMDRRESGRWEGRSSATTCTIGVTASQLCA